MLSVSFSGGFLFSGLIILLLSAISLGISQQQFVQWLFIEQWTARKCLTNILSPLVILLWQKMVQSQMWAIGHKIGLPTVPDSPGQSRNWPAASRVPDRVDVSRNFWQSSAIRYDTEQYHLIFLSTKELTPEATTINCKIIHVIMTYESIFFCTHCKCLEQLA